MKDVTVYKTNNGKTTKVQSEENEKTKKPEASKKHSADDAEQKEE